MKMNFKLEAGEMALGFVMSCPSRVLTKTLCVDFNNR